MLLCDMNVREREKAVMNKTTKVYTHSWTFTILNVSYLSSKVKTIKLVSKIPIYVKFHVSNTYCKKLEKFIFMFVDMTSYEGREGEPLSGEYAVNYI